MSLNLFAGETTAAPGEETTAVPSGKTTKKQ